jgi:hypothetical protein
MIIAQITFEVYQLDTACCYLSFCLSHSGI